IGEPDFDTPISIKDAAKKALDAGDTHYFSSGSDVLKDKIIETLSRENLNYNSNEVIVTPGSKQGIFYSLFLMARGTEVIVIDPSYPAYSDVVEIVGGNAVGVNCGKDYIPDPDAISRAVTPKTSMIVINTPNNPTGLVYKKSLLEEIADIAIEKDLYVLTDEIYKSILFEGKHVSIASLNGMKERCILTSGFSKTYAMTGWRLGYACAPEELIAQMKNLQQQTAIAPTAFVQSAGIKALDGASDKDVRKMVDEYKRRRDIFSKSMRGMGGLNYREPQGAFYCFPDFGELTGLRGMELFTSILESGVSGVPGSFFGASYGSHVRFSLAQSMDKVKEGAERIRGFCENLPEKHALAH
ncbi:MAG: pyridoxal phosphate-dependent aminotransferase, partial [Candidatus Aenigmarchaeota archaeon]|nr:pyridoxal phosphate-dependent aminotransferase [Candidatus Aenigmarchaeota archaeon]